MSKFENVHFSDEIPPIGSDVVAIDFTLVHGQGKAAGVEQFTFTPKLHNDEIEHEILPAGVREHPEVRNILFGVLKGKGGVSNYKGPFPGDDAYVESMHMEQAKDGQRLSYVYSLKRAKAEFGVGNNKPGYLVISEDGLSFYPKPTHPKAEAVAAVSGALLALGGVVMVLHKIKSHDA